ncbi:MAG: M48 family metallopeptidase [Candidatus Berkelbacteria bacterium]|nr:M48 family metallopeptidase [Candidatus Berkelbacteria bacterium]
MYKEVDRNKRNTFFLIFFFIIFIIGLGWALSYIFNNQLILIIAVIIAVTQSWISYYYSDKIVLSMSHAKGPIKKKDSPELYRLVENLCITAGLPRPKIYIIEDSAPNAFATGRNPDHAVVCFTTGILEKLEKVELEGVIAHELSHIGNWDILLQTVIVTLVGVIVLISDFSLRTMFFRRRSDGEGGGILLIVGLLLLILSPLFAILIQLAVSRKREYLADASGALLTRYPEGLARALKKISADKEPLEVANRATAHLYIVNPVKKQSQREEGNSFFANLFSTHPPIKDRVKKLREMVAK